MWLIDEIEIRDVHLDFTSSSGGRPHTQAVYSGGTCLVNAISFAELGDDPAQLIVCEACGFIRCQPGGWIHIRRIGNSIAFIPAFAEMLAGDFELSQFSPPQFTDIRGTPIFAPNVYEHLRIRVPAFPTIDKLQSITAADAVRLIQWHAPLNILGRFPAKPQLMRDAILAVSDGQLNDECSCVQEFLNANGGSSARLSATPCERIVPIEFHLDAPGFPAWRPVARLGDQVVFNLEPIAAMMPSVENAA